MNAHTPIAHHSSVSAITLGVVVPFVPRAAAVAAEPVHEPEEIATEAGIPHGWSVIEGGAETVTDSEVVTDLEPEAPAPFVGGGNALADRAALSRALDIIANVVERRNTIPILSNVCLTAAGDNLLVTGTDLDVELAVAFPAAIDSHFNVTLPAHTLKDLLKKATASDFVDITAPTNEGPAIVDFERVNYKLQALPAADFPSLSVDGFSHSFAIPGADLVESFGGVVMAISTEETRYYLNGVYLHHVDGTLRMASTDGHRLCRQDLAAPEGCEGMPGIIIPRKTVALVQKLMKGKSCPETVKVQLSDTKLRLTFDDVTITSKLIDGTFPDYQRVIPTQNDKPATFNSADLSEGIRAVSLISSERGRAVKFAFSAGKCQLVVNNPDQGSAVADIATDYASDGLDIGFNASYLQAFIATAGGTDFTLTLADAGSPAIVTTTGRNGWLGVIMPMRV